MSLLRSDWMTNSYARSANLHLRTAWAAKCLTHFPCYLDMKFGQHCYSRYSLRATTYASLLQAWSRFQIWLQLTCVNLELTTHSTEMIRNYSKIMKLAYLLVEINWTLLNLHLVCCRRQISALIESSWITRWIHLARYSSTSLHWGCELSRLASVFVGGAWKCLALSHDTSVLCVVWVLTLQELMLAVEVVLFFTLVTNRLCTAILRIGLLQALFTRLHRWLVQLGLLLPSESVVVWLTDL